ALIFDLSRLPLQAMAFCRKLCGLTRREYSTLQFFNSSTLSPQEHVSAHARNNRRGEDADLGVDEIIGGSSEGKCCDEERHGEADAAHHSQAKYGSEVYIFGECRPLEFDE